MTTLTLADILDNLAKTLQGGKDNPVYTAIVNALNTSPDLVQQMDTAISSGRLTALSFDPNGQGGEYDNGTIDLSGPLLQSIVEHANSSDPSTSSGGLSSLVSLLAHETYHSNSSESLQEQRQDYANQHTQIDDSTIVDWVKGYAQIGLNDESRAAIVAWNDAVAAAALANGGPLSADQIQNLATSNEFAYPLFQLNPDKSVSPLSGLVLGADGTIDMAVPGNLATVSEGLSLTATSTDSTGYLLFYTRSALNEAASRTTDPLTISYDSLGLTKSLNSANLEHTPTGTTPYESEQVSEWLAAGQYSQRTVIVNSDDGSRSTFETDADGTGTTLTFQWAVTENNDQQYEVVDIDAQSGELRYGHYVDIHFDGSTDVTLIGSGDVLNMSLANVLLTESVSGTVNGDRNTISLQKGASLDVSGQDNVVKTAGNEHVNLLGDGSSITLQSSYGNVAMKASHQTVTMGQGTLTAGNGLVGETIVGVPSTGAPGQVVLVNVTAGTDDEFTVQNIGVYYNGGARNTIHASGGSYDFITVGDDSQLDISTTADGYAMVTASHSTVAFSGDANGEVDGSNDTITVDHLTNLQLMGDDNSVDGSLDSVVIYGNGNNLALDDGAQIYIGFGSQGNVINASHATISGGDGDETFVGSYNDFINLSGGTYTITGDTNSLQMTDATVDIDGSNNILTGYDSTVHIIGGTDDDVQLDDSTITAGDGADFMLSGYGNTVVAGTGTYTIAADDNDFTAGSGTFTVNGSDNQLSVGDNSSLTIDGRTTLTADQSDIVYQDNDGQTQDLTGIGNTVQGAEGTYKVHGTGNHLAVTDGYIYLDGAADGTTDISGSGNDVHVDGSTINYTGDSASGVHGQDTGITLWGSGNTVLATDSEIDLIADDGATLTVTGAGNTIDPGYGSAVITVNGANMTDATTLELYESEATGNTGYYAVDAQDSTFHFGDGSHLHILSYFTNTLYVNNATIDLEDSADLIVYGNNNTFTGGHSVDLKITGTGNSVTTTDGNIVFVGDNTGDVVFGAGNDGANWSAPDPDLPPGDHGGYTPPGGGAVTGTASVDHLIHAMASFGAAGGVGLSQPTAVRHDDHMLVAAA